MPFHMNLCFELHFRFHGCSDLISQLLIRTLHSDLTKLTSFFQLFFTDYIFHLIIASYKILICDHMPGNFQKIAFRLYLQPEMSPSAPLDCKSFADRFTDIIKSCSDLPSVQFLQDPFFPFRSETLLHAEMSQAVFESPL